jgi:uncharacterized protein (DUF1499 family)
MKFIKTKKGGLVNNQLTPCPSSPNNVASEHHNNKNKIDAFTFDCDASKAWEEFKASVEQKGGEIKESNDIYLWATFSTQLLKFVDDFEARLSCDDNRIHIRSISRMGYSDLNVNRNRVESIRTHFTNSVS